MKRGKLWIAICAIAVSVMAGCLTACGGSSHKTVLHEAKAATCTEQGNEAYYSCEHCDKLFADAAAKTEVKREDVFHAALGHEISDDSYVEGEPNSCTEAGVLAHYTCSRCHNAFADKSGTILIEDAVLPAGHSLGEHVSYLAPSIADEGRAEYYVCNDCGKYFTDEACKQEILPEDTVLPRVSEYSVAITVKTYDKDGNESAIPTGFIADIHSPVALDAEYVLSVATDGTATNNKDNDGKYAAGTYRINADGFYSAQFTIAETDTQKEIALYALDRTLSNPDGQRYITGMRDENGNKSYTFNKDYSSGAWNTLGMLELADKTSGQSYLYEFKISLAQTPSADWNNRLLLVFADSDTANGFSGDGKEVVGIGMALSAENLALYNLQQSWENRTNTPKEYGSSGSTAADRAVMSAFYRSAMNGGLAMRVARLRDAVHFYVNINDSWILFREVTLSVKSDNGFVIAALGNADITVSQIQEAIYVPIAENDEFVTLEHFVMGEKLYDASGAETTQAALTKSFVELTSFTAVPKEFTLYGTVEGVISTSDVSYEIKIDVNGAVMRKDGKPNKFVPGTYTVKPAGGYYSTEIEIAEGVAGVSFDLYRLEDYLGISNPDGFEYVAPIVNDGKKEVVIDKAYADNTTWGQLGLLEIANPNSANNGTLYMTEFTMRLDGAGNMDWTQRLQFAFASADKLRSNAANKMDVVGFYMFFPTNLTKVGSATAKWDERYQESQPNITEAFMTEAAAGTLRVRIVRNGTYAALYMKLNGEWQKLHEVTLTSSAVDGGFSIAGVGVQKLCFSGFTFVEYVENVEPDADGDGMRAHFKAQDGTLYDLNGEETTEEALVIKLVTLDTFTVNADFALTTPVSGKLVGANGVEYNITIATDKTVSNGKGNKFVPGTYTVKLADGYYSTEIEITVSTASVSFDLYRLEEYFAISKPNGSDCVTTAVNNGTKEIVLQSKYADDNTWGTVGLFSVAESKAGEISMTEFTLRRAGNKSWQDRMYFAFAGAEKLKNNEIGKDIIGFYLIFTDTDGIKVGAAYTKMGERSNGDGLEIGLSDPNAFYTAANNGTLRVRLVRNGTTATLYMNFGDAWEKIHTVTLTSSAVDGGISSFATGQAVMLSGFEFAEYVEPQEATEDSDGVRAHFILDGEYFDLTGKETTAEAVTIKRIHITDFTVDPESALTEPITGALTSDDTTYTLTIGTDNSVSNGNDNYFLSGTYTFTAEGYYTAEIEIAEGVTSVSIKLCKVEEYFDLTNPFGKDYVTPSVDGDKKEIVVQSEFSNGNTWETVGLFGVDASKAGEISMTEFALRLDGTGDTSWEHRIHFAFASAEKLQSNASAKDVIGFYMIFPTNGIRVGAAYTAWTARSNGENLEIQPDITDEFHTAASSGTLRVRLVRNGTYAALYMNFGNGWEKIHTVTLTSSAVDGGISVSATGTQAVALSGFAFAEYVARVEPTEETDGMRAYFKLGDEYFDLTGEKTTQDALVIKLVSLESFTVNAVGFTLEDSISGKLIDANGTEYGITIAANGAVTRTDGKPNKFVVGTYTVKLADGYYSTEIAISNSTTSVSFDLYGLEEYFAISKPDGSDYVTTAVNNGTKEIVLQSVYSDENTWEKVGLFGVDASKAGEISMTEFTLRRAGNKSWQDRMYFAFASAEKLKSNESGKDIIGFYLIFTDTDGIRVGAVKNDMGQSEAIGLSDPNAFYTAANNGTLRVRLVRNGTSATLYMNFGDAWEKIHTVTLTSSAVDGGISSFATGQAVMLSGFAFAEYTEQVEPTDTADGMRAHFTLDGKYFDLTGEETTEEELKINRIQITDFTVDPETALTEAITGRLTSAEKTYTLTIGMDNSVSNGNENYFLSGTYTFTADGYIPQTVVITQTTQSVKLPLQNKQYNITVPESNSGALTESVQDGKHILTFNNGWSDTRKWNEFAFWEIKGGGAEQNYMAEFALVLSGDTAQDDTTNNMWQSRLYFVGAGAATACSYESGSDVVGIGVRFPSTSTRAFSLTTKWDDMNNPVGLTFQTSYRMRIARNGNKMLLYYQNGAEWSLVTSVTLSSKADNGLCIMAGNSAKMQFVISDLTLYEYVPEDETDSAIVKAHLKDSDGENWFTLDGVPVSDKSSMEITLVTINPFTVTGAGGVAREAKLIGSGVEYEIVIDSNGNVTRKDGKSKFAPDTYTFTAGWCFEETVTIAADTTTREVALTLYQYDLHDSTLKTGSAVETKDHNIVFNTGWYDSKNIPNMAFWEVEKNNTEQDYEPHYRVEFNVYVADISGLKKYQNRIYFMGASYEKAIAFADGTDILGMCMRFDAKVYTAVQKADGTEIGAFTLTDNSVKLCLIRDGNGLTLQEYKDGGWATICSVTLQNYDNGLTVATENNEAITFSEIAKYTYVAEARTDSMITYAHYVDESGILYDLNGKQVSNIADLQTALVTIETFTVTGANEITDTLDARLIGSGIAYEVSIDSNGSVTRKDDSNVYAAGEYTLVAAGYKNTAITVSADNTSLTGELKRFGIYNPAGQEYITREGGTYTFKQVYTDAQTTTDWKNNCYLEIVGNGASNDYTVTFSITTRKGSGTQMDRLFFVGASQEKAVTYKGTDTGTIGIGTIYYDFAGGPCIKRSDIAAKYDVNGGVERYQPTATATGNYDCKIVRKGNTLSFYVKGDQNGGTDWTLVHSATLTGNVDNGFGIFGLQSNTNLTVFDIVFTDNTL